MQNADRIYRAIVRGELKQVEALVSQDPLILRETAVGKNWLHWAAQKGHVNILSFLVTAGLNVDSMTDDGTSTALEIAAGQGRVDCCEWLLANGADPNRRFGEAATPIFSAIYGRSLELVNLFIQNGARLDAQFGIPPIDVLSYANQYGTSEIVSFLEQQIGGTNAGKSLTDRK